MPIASSGRAIRALVSSLLLAGLAALTPRAALAAPAAGDVVGTVRDSASGEPLQGGEVRVMRGSELVANAVTDQFGRFVIHHLAPGRYAVQARLIGYRPQSRDVVIADDGATTPLTFHLVTLPIGLQAVTVTAQAPIAVDTRSGDQVFKQNDYHGAPTNTTSQVLQQSIVGAARAPTGEVHIRGQHAEYTYYVDGVPVPSGISGSMNELFDPSVVDRIDFQTGGWDAEYGNKNAAVVNVLTRIPAGGFQAELSSYAGSFNANGQGITLSGNAGRWGVFGSGARQESGMRLEPVMFDTATNDPINFHNRGEDLYAFGKVQFTPSSRDVLNLDVNWSRTRFGIPFDSTGGVVLDDHQQDINSFANLSWRRPVGGGTKGAA
ncbi:MAG: TonB-dependent receptor, partial [Gemmatimonadaceae bacterium]|nr:TonB-dependent receptor [Gemmatimonadaceae bacterium]